MSDSCACCGKNAPSHTCSGCFDAHYCNETCQRDHWQQLDGHREVCARIGPNVDGQEVATDVISVNGELAIVRRQHMTVPTCIACDGTTTVVSYSNASTVRTFERASYKVRGGFAASDKSLRFAGVAVARNDPVFHGATNSITFRVLAVVESTQGQLRVYDNAIGVQHLLRAFDLRAHFANCRPYAVATDHYGNFVITDTARHSVYVISKSGALVREFGRQGSGDGEFNEPRGVALTSGGDIVVIDSLNSRVQIFDTNGAFLTAFGRLGAGDGEFNEPTGVAVDSAGTIVVADPRNRRIQMFRRSGAFVRAFTHASFVAPRDVAVVINGDMMVIDGEANALFVVGVPAKPGALYASPASNAVHNDVRCQIANWYTLQEIDRDDVASRRLRPCKRCG